MGERQGDGENKTDDGQLKSSRSSQALGEGDRQVCDGVDWVTHVNREHNKMADWWAEKGAKGKRKERATEEEIKCLEVCSLTGFWDGMGNARWVASSLCLRWLMGGTVIYKTCELVTGGSASEAKIE